MGSLFAAQWLPARLVEVRTVEMHIKFWVFLNFLLLHPPLHPPPMTLSTSQGMPKLLPYSFYGSSLAVYGSLLGSGLEDLPSPQCERERERERENIIESF